MLLWPEKVLRPRETQEFEVGRPGSIWELSTTTARGYGGELKGDFLEEWKPGRPAANKEKYIDGLDSLRQWDTEERAGWRKS